MISIIVPVYNSEGTIKACVESIIAQDYKDWELLLVDDGSMDRSLVLCDEFARQDIRIHVISQKHQGVSIARNNGLEKVRGKYVCFVDSDDVVDSNHLSSMYAKRDYDMVICGYSVDEYDTNGCLLTQTKHVPDEVCVNELADQKLKLLPLFMIGMIHINCNKLLKVDVIRDNQLTYKIQPVNEDYMFMVDYLMHAKSVCTAQNTTYHWKRIQNTQSGVSSMPENLLQIYIDAHMMTRCFFNDVKVADEIMYYTYYYVVLKYLKAIENGSIGKSIGLKKMHQVMSNQYVRAAFKTRKNVTIGERILNTLLLCYQFLLFDWVNKTIIR